MSEALRIRSLKKRHLQHCASVREGTQGLMPLSPLNQIRMDRQIAKLDTRQHWIALPQGVSGKLRLKHLTCLSNLSRISIPDRLVRPLLQRARVLASRRVLDLIDDPRFSPAGRGDAEDGVPHAEALSPANTDTFSQRIKIAPASCVYSALAVSSALATTPKISPM